MCAATPSRSPNQVIARVETSTTSSALSGDCQVYRNRYGKLDIRIEP
jgi:hypothetical protein